MYKFLKGIADKLSKLRLKDENIKNSDDKDYVHHEITQRDNVLIK